MSRADLAIEYTPSHGPRRRVRYLPRDDEGYWRVADEWTGCTWRETGREAVQRLLVDDRLELAD